MKSVIIGAGSYGEVYASYLLESGIEIVGFIDDNPSLKGQYILGKIVFGDRNELYNLKESCGIEAVYCSIGNNSERVELLQFALSLGYKTPYYIHPTANISKDSSIADGVFVFPGTIVMPKTKINEFSIIGMGVTIGHHSTIEKGCFISSGVTFGANIIMKEESFIGLGAIVMTGIREIGRNSIIGAGAVVINDVHDNVVVVGNPAPFVRNIDIK